MRSRARLGLTPEKETTLPLSSLSRAVRGDSPFTCTLGLRVAAADERIAGLAKLSFVSHKDIQSSVKLRQMLSAFRRTCRSAVPALLYTDAAELCMPVLVLPAISAKAIASDAVDSSVRYTD